MRKAELFKAEPIVKDEEIFMVIEFSLVAKWTPEVILKEEIPIAEYLEFLDIVLEYKETGEVRETSNNLKPFFLASVGKIFYKDVYILFKKAQLYALVEMELLKLVQNGILGP